jgi:integrase
VRNKEALIVRQSELLALGEDLIDATQRMPPPTSRTAAVEQSLLLRDGLIIASLALRPLRCRNFLDLEVGRTLRREQDGWWIDIPAAATKTGVRLRQAFPARLQPALEEFLALHRPRLAGQRAFGPVALRSEPLSPLLWLSRSGAPLSACSLLKLLRRHTRPRFGHAINPHLARDIAATSLADAHPEHMRIAADLLGHKSFATTQRVYIAARQKWALRQVQAEVLRARRLSRRPPSLPTWKPE